MVPTLSYTNVSSSIVLVLVHKCIVYQHIIVEICCEVLTFYCCNKYCSLSISELQEHASSHCSLLWYTKGTVYQQNYYKIGAVPVYKVLCMYVFRLLSYWSLRVVL